MPPQVSIRPRRRQTLQLLPQRARINDVLSLRTLVENARDDLIRARHELADVQRRWRAVELHVGTAEACFESIVGIYNRLVVEYEPQDGRAG